MFQRFRYPVVRAETPDGAPIEGVWTVPDIAQEPTPEERAAAADLQLAKAVEIVKKAQADPDELRQALAGAKPAWQQSMDLAPTAAEDRRLSEIAPLDELPARRQAGD